MTGFLVDTSAFVRLTEGGSAAELWSEHLAAGRLAICPVTELEILYSARSSAHRAEILDLLRLAFIWAPMPDRAFARAAEVQEGLTGRGKHRSAGPVDLLVAAAAEGLGMTLLHLDADFDQVGDFTGQPMVKLGVAASG